VAVVIARNYTRHPEALRFQRELFSNGYHNQPRLMRLMECIFDWTPAAPAWWTAAKAKARALAKAIKKSIADFFKEMTVKASDQLSFPFETPKPPARLKQQHGTWEMETILEVLARPERRCYRTVCLNADAPSWAAGFYINNCEGAVRRGRAIAPFNYAAEA